MDPITRRNNSEIQQLRMGPPMKIRAQLVIGRWLAGSPTCQVLQLPSLSFSLSRQILALFIRSPATRSLRAYRAVTPAAYPHDTLLRTSVYFCQFDHCSAKEARTAVISFATSCELRGLLYDGNTNDTNNWIFLFRTNNYLITLLDIFLVHVLFYFLLQLFSSSAFKFALSNFLLHYTWYFIMLYKKANTIALKVN